MKDLIIKKFIYGGNSVDGPSWGMTTIFHGSMRYRHNEINENRISFLDELCSEKNNGGVKKAAAGLELIHSKKIYDIENSLEVQNMQGDGIITRNKKLIPVVTVADCVPIFICDLNSGTFGALHSGWKGTGIVGEAIAIIEKKYGSSPKDICVAIGPHIGDCCYNIDKERAGYFCDNFGTECVRKIDGDNWALSLTKANLAVLDRAGIPHENIVVHDPCTCCHRENGEFKFGSFRRQTLGLPSDMPLEEKMLKFTVQAAFVKWN